MSDYLSKLIKKILEENPTDPPVEVWQNVANGLDINDVWDSLETQLDLNGVWHDVQSTLQHAHHLKIYDQISHYASVAVIAIGLTGSILNATITTENQLSEEGSQDNLPGISMNEGLVQDQLSNEEEINEIDGSAGVVSQPTNTQISERRASLDLLSEGSPELPLLAAEKSPAPQAPIDIYAPIELTQMPGTRKMEMLISSPVLTPPDSLQSLLFSDYKRPDQARWYVGFSSGLRNNWLLNQKTINNFSSDVLNSTEFDFNSELAVLAGYNLSRSISIQSEVYLIAGEGQRYQEYIGGNYLPTSINLNYHKLELLLKKKNYYQRPRNGRLHSAYLFGIFVGHLAMANETIGSSSTSLDGAFTRFNFGLSGGYELSYSLSSRFSVHPSVRIRYGINDIFKGGPSENNFLEDSRTASIGVNLGVLYHLNRQ